MRHPRRAWLIRRTSRRTGPAALLVLLLALATGLVGLSPIGLGLFGGGKDTWERLSFIGQTYGAASALLSAFALVGIAITLVLQAREVKVSREQGQRLLHVDLLKMAMENPLYRRAWGPLAPGRRFWTEAGERRLATSVTRRERHFTGLWTRKTAPPRPRGPRCQTMRPGLPWEDAASAMSRR